MTHQDWLQGAEMVVSKTVATDAKRGSGRAGARYNRPRKQSGYKEFCYEDESLVRNAG
ncbi:hypothetical protein APED_32800 [Acanthopleuribacter pedis]